MTDTQIMTLWLIPNLYDWRSHEWGLMGNEVTSDHGEVLSFYVYPLSCWEDSDEFISIV
jgi:membrane protein YdbS with pleckstrin-like domain